MAVKAVIHSVFEEVAQQRAREAAISSVTGSVTYAELNGRANRLARELVERRGVARGAVVGLHLTAGVDYVVAMLGVLKAGGTFLPLDPSTPEPRQRKFLTKARPSLVIVSNGGEAGPPAFDFGVPVIGLGLGEADRGDESNPPLAVGGDDACYVVFTSGSTGEPKAILGTQKGLSHFVHWEVKEFALDGAARISLLAPPTFDVSLRDIFVPLLAGGTLCIPPDATRGDARQLLDWFEAERVSLVHCVPSLFRALLGELEADARRGARLASLRHVLLAGEPLYAADVRRWRALFGERVELVNLYGPSETTLAKAFHRIRDIDDHWRTIPVGRPLPNAALFVVKDGQLCDPGERGEIGEVYISTPFMSKGYLGDPRLTAEVFVQNPLNAGKPDIVYRTGDLGRYLPDMSVELLGRLDNQVKVRGVRIELAEIERELRGHEKIADAAVVAVETAGETNLAAYFVAAEPLSDAELREHFRQRLPASHHPAYFVRMDEGLPRNLHGKVDRRALPPPSALLYRQRPYEAPADETERAVAAIWSELLGLMDVGVNHGFLELGGNSLKAVQLTGRIYERFGVEVGLNEILGFKSQGEKTVRTLASVVSELRRSAGRGDSRDEEDAAAIAPATADELELLMRAAGRAQE